MPDVEVVLRKPHPTQQEFLTNRVRFNVLKCGRRWGKTEITQELFSEIISRRGIVAYFSPTYKDLHEVWQETKRLFRDIIYHSDSTVKQIIFLGGAKLDMWSMEDPDSGRGRKYHRVILDECEKAGKFQESWEQTVRATIVDYKGDAYLLSTPQFGETYFKQICKNEDRFSDWKTFIYTTYDNPHIDTEEIEQAKALLLPSVFSCEYLAEDVDGKALNPFAHQWDDKYHTGREAVLESNKRLLIWMDFNVDPYAVTFWHFFQDSLGYHLHGIDEHEMMNGNIPAMIDYISLTYSAHLHSCIITGDSMGDQRNIARRDLASHYMEIAKGLNLGEHQVQVPHNPLHKDSRADVNWLLYVSKLPNPKHFVKLHPERMKKTIQDFWKVQCDSFGEIVKRNRKIPSQRADFIDTARNGINWLKVTGKIPFPNFK